MVSEFSASDHYICIIKNLTIVVVGDQCPEDLEGGEGYC